MSKYDNKKGKKMTYPKEELERHSNFQKLALRF